MGQQPTIGIVDCNTRIITGSFYSENFHIEPGLESESSRGNGKKFGLIIDS